MSAAQIQHGKRGQIITKIDKGILLQIGGERKTTKTYLALCLAICTPFRNCHYIQSEFYF